MLERVLNKAPGNAYKTLPSMMASLPAQLPGGTPFQKPIKAAQPHFSRISVTDLILSKPVISTFNALDQKDSMLPIAFRDAFDSSGRVYEEWKRDPHGGRESAINEGSASLVWGCGIPAFKSGFDWVAQKTGLAFPNLDLSLLQYDKSAPWMENLQKQFSTLKTGLQNKIPAFLKSSSQPIPPLPSQMLTKEAVDKYFKEVGQQVFGEQSDKMKKELQTLVNHEGKQNMPLITKYMQNQLAKLIICTTLPVVILVWLSTSFAQRITKKSLQKEQAKQIGNALPLVAPQTLPVVNSPFVSSPVPSFRQLEQMLNAPRSKMLNSAVKFAGMAEALNPLVAFFLKHEQLNGMVGTDFPLSSTRLAMVRNKYEFVEKLIGEFCMIIVLFYAQQKIQDKVSQGLDSWLDTRHQIGFKALKGLHKELGVSKNSNDAFNKLYDKLKADLGLASDQALEAFEKQPDAVQKIREYFYQAEKRTNVFYNLAEVSGKIPVRKAKTGNVKYFDISREIDLKGMRDLAKYLDKLALLSKEGKNISRHITRNVGVKMGAFGISSAACWLIVSHFLPKVQHWVTFKWTGKHFFPGAVQAAETA